MQKWEIEDDILFDKSIGSSDLHANLQELPSSIYSVLASFDEAFVVLDGKLIIAFGNDKASGILKKIVGNDFTVGENILTLFQTQQQVIIKEYLHEALKGTAVSHELEFVKNALPVWIKCSYKPLNTEHGIVGVCMLFKKISMKKGPPKETKNKLGEETHFQSRVLFETFMENTPLTSWITNEQGLMLYMNPAFRKSYDLPHSNIPLHMREIFPKDLADEYFENNLLAVQSGKMIEVVERILKQDGNMGIYKVFRFPMNIENETMIGGWSIEITEETKLQEQLTNSMERYSYVNEATSDAIYDWEVNTNTLYRGKGFAILFGYHDPYVPLEYRFSRIHPDDIETVKKTYLGSLQDRANRRWKLKYRFKDAKGVYRNVVDKAFLIWENGKVVRVIGAIQDITEYSQLQEKLVLQEEIKKRAIVRSIIETQEKERRQLSVELHDNVNQILSSCKLMLEVAKENKDKAPVLTEKSYQSIQLAIAEIRKISHDLNPSAVEDFGLKEAISEMIEKVNLSDKINIVFRYTVIGKKIPLKSESKIAIYRIVQEQLNNILKHAQATNVSILLTIRTSQVHLVIEDDGIGFSLKKSNKGLGLKNINHRVEYYHGTLDIKTARNKGCKMTVLLNISSAA